MVPPVVDLNGAAAGNDATATFTEQTPLGIAPSATITDIDSANLQSLTATLTARPDGDAVEVAIVNAAATAAAAGLTVSILASGILPITAREQGHLPDNPGRHHHKNTSDTPITTSRTVNMVANDGATTASVTL